MNNELIIKVIVDYNKSCLCVVWYVVSGPCDHHVYHDSHDQL